MLHPIPGAIDREKVAAFSALRQDLSEMPFLEGTLFLGFPLVEVAGETSAVDAVIVSEKYGIVVIDVRSEDHLEPETLSNRQDDIYISLRNRFIKRESLRLDRDRLKFDLRLLTYAPFAVEQPSALRSCEISQVFSRKVVTH